MTATNGADIEGPKANPTTFSSIGIPEVPGRPSVTTPSPNQSRHRPGLGGRLPVRRRSPSSSGATATARTGTVSCGCPEGSSGSGPSRTWAPSTRPSRCGPSTAPTGRRGPPEQHLPALHRHQDAANLNGDTERQPHHLAVDLPHQWSRRRRDADAAATAASPGAAFLISDSPQTSYTLDGKPGNYYEIRVRAHTPRPGGATGRGWDRVTIPDPHAEGLQCSKGRDRGQSGSTGSCASAVPRGATVAIRTSRRARARRALLRPQQRTAATTSSVRRQRQRQRTTATAGAASLLSADNVQVTMTVATRGTVSSGFVNWRRARHPAPATRTTQLHPDHPHEDHQQKDGERHP